MQDIQLPQGMRKEFGSVGAVCSIKERSGPQNQRVHIVLKESLKKASPQNQKVQKVCPKDLRVRAPAAPVLTHSLL